MVFGQLISVSTVTTTLLCEDICLDLPACWGKFSKLVQLYAAKILSYDLGAYNSINKFFCLALTNVIQRFGKAAYHNLASWLTAGVSYNLFLILSFTGWAHSAIVEYLLLSYGRYSVFFTHILAWVRFYRRVSMFIWRLPRGKRAAI
mgnify:FL=1